MKNDPLARNGREEGAAARTWPDHRAASGLRAAPPAPPTRRSDARTFQEAIELFVRACPGPPLAEQGLRLVAYQGVPGIPGLDPAAAGSDIGPTPVAKRAETGSEGRYFASVVQVASRLRVRPAYLSQ